MRFQYLISSFAALAAQAISPPSSDANELRAPHTTFRPQIQNDTGLRYVMNSGVCETTPGVNQYSGYLDVGTNMSMWFWFFEARHSPEAVPFTLWLNGGPGCSSMYGLFLENGPCKVNSDRKTTYLNPYSWNNVSNVIYLDQPINVGFSYGTNTVNSTETAAPIVWKALQILFESQVFSKYRSRKFIFATESYGGRYTPVFITYFHDQNNLIARGDIEGECIIVSALMVNSGWLDPLIQYSSYYNFTSNAPGYGPLLPNDVLKKIFDGLYGPDGCVTREKNCYAAGNSPGSDDICGDAGDYCLDNVYDPAMGDRSPNDLRRKNSSAPFPPNYFADYLLIPEVMKKIGAEANFTQCTRDSQAYLQILETGDDARTSLPLLSKLANSGLQILIWNGDADINCNWLGGYASALALDWYGKETFHNTPLSNITLHGITVAAVASVDNLSFAVVYDAGHMLIAYQPAVALEIFSQTINEEPLHSV